MKKIKVTQKQIKDTYKNILSIGYCNIQYLLQYQAPRYYTAGIYGWNADIYEIDDNTAFYISHNYDLPYEERKEKVDKLLQEFVNKVLEKKE